MLIKKVLKDQKELIKTLHDSPMNPFSTIEDYNKAQRKTYDIPFTEGYNLENLAHGVGGVGGLEQKIKALTSTEASEPFGEEQKKSFLDAIIDLVSNLR